MNDASRPTVLKFGGAFADDPALLARAARATAALAARRPLVVMPGGGPFADLVRTVDAAWRLDPTTAHRMAILAMDQYGHLLAERIPGARLVHWLDEVAAAHSAGALPVLAPAQWLRANDSLPHRWEVTSDSLAAYLANALDATELLLLKRAVGDLATLADPYFPRARPEGLAARCVTVEALEALAGGLA